MVQIVEESLRNAELSVDDIDWLVLHQANQRILDSAAERLKMRPDRVVTNLAKYGNTSAASIPLALDEAVRGGAIKSGETVHASPFGSVDVVEHGKLLSRWPVAGAGGS